MVTKELTSFGFRGPEAESRPSKQVFLFVRAALRYAFASASFLELVERTRATDLCKDDSVIWWSSLQSWTVPLCFSTMLLDCPAVERRLESFPDSEMAVLRDWRRKVRMLGPIFMEMESFNELKQTSGYGVG